MDGLLDLAATAPWSFVIGAAIGFVVGARYRISKRGDDENTADE